jgi:transcriptional regulator with XRE-family HTH domain
MTYDFSVLRELRKKRKLTIAKLSELCGVSYVALSKLERGQGNPELRTLDRVSRALGLATHNLLALAEQKQPIRATAKTCKVLGKADCRQMALDGVRVFCITAPQGASGWAPEFHVDDFERCFVLDGKVRVTVRGQPYVLGPGEGLSWDCLFEHNYEVLEPATFITVLTPKRP